jgi:hypothetical protein
VADLEQVGINVLMAGDASVGAHVKIFQIAHAGGDAVGVGKVAPRMRAQPLVGRPMAAFAGDTDAVVNLRRSLRWRNFMKRSMTRRASSVRRGRAQLESFGHDLRAPRGERGVGAGMKILPRPNDKLVAITGRPSMTTGGAASLCAEESWNRCCFVRLCGNWNSDQNSDENEDETKSRLMGRVRWTETGVWIMPA